MLTLTEELFLLTLHERKNGSVAISPTMALPYCLAGAMLMELSLLNKIRLNAEKKVELLDATPVEQSWLNEILERMSIEKRVRKAAFWVNVTGSKGKKIRKELIASLLAKGILRQEEKRYLWVIPYTEYTQQDASAKYWRKLRLRAIVLTGEKIDESSAALLSLLRAGGLLDHLFTRDEIKAASTRTDELIQDEAIGQAVMETMDEISTAAAAAAIAAASA